MDIQLGVMLFLLSIALSIPIILLKIFDKRGREARKQK